jgi:tetratricopeptide (TPR) repeat protein
MGNLRHLSKLAAVSAVLTGVALGWPGTLPVQADTLLEEMGEITPAEASYRFDGVAGQAITITLDSDDFDPVLVLLDSSENEIASNDDFGGTLNSTIIVELPADDTYTVIARSFSGNGGNFDLLVRTSTDYEVSFAKAQSLAEAEDYTRAIDSFTEAIDIDPEQPAAYLGRAEAYLGQVYLEQGDAIQGPGDIPIEIRELIIADFDQAADLIELNGSQDWADSLREQADYLRNADAMEPNGM